MLKVNAWIRCQLMNQFLVHFSQSYYQRTTLHLKELIIFYDQVWIQSLPQNFWILRVDHISFLSCMKNIWIYNTEHINGITSDFTAYNPIFDLE